MNNLDWAYKDNNMTWNNPSWSTIGVTSTNDYVYSLNLGNTSLETKDIDFIHKLYEAAGEAGDCATVLAQMIQHFKEQDWSTYSWTGNMHKNIQENKEKEEEMDILKSFNFGPCGDRAKISHLGVAVKNLNGEWVSYDKSADEIVNVDLINFSGKDFVYMIPVALKDIAIGDAICHNKHVMFVKKIKEDGIVATDVTAGEVKKILPTKSIFGFDFITKLVSLIDLSGVNANAENPFGNLLPFLLLSNNNEGDDVLPLALMMMNGNQLDVSNPLMLMILLNSNKNISESGLLPMMMCGSLFNKGN